MTLRRLMILVFAAVIASAGAPPSLGEDAGPLPPFQAYVDMKTFMEHVLTPAAAVIWRVNAIVIDEKGEHDLSPKSEAEWEQIESGAATLAEATNALMRGTCASRQPSLASRPYGGSTRPAHRP